MCPWRWIQFQSSPDVPIPDASWTVLSSGSRSLLEEEEEEEFGRDKHGAEFAAPIDVSWCAKQNSQPKDELFPPNRSEWRAALALEPGTNARACVLLACLAHP
uniref:Uncharacterized protein n=1 Tax=Anopheles farauti TaxID=69004 RepID=A0A182QXI8_9DIPT